MAFSYDLSSAVTLTLNISRARLYAGDNSENAGILPSGANFQDDEIELFLDNEDESPGRAAAAMCEAAMAHWSTQPSDVRVGPRQESRDDIIDNLKAACDMLRDTWGHTQSSSTVFVSSFNRQDAYEDAAGDAEDDYDDD